MVRPSFALLALAVSAASTAAQESPYVGRVSQTIKALTAEEVSA